MSKDEYLITDAPLKALTVFAMPMILGSFFQQVYNMADSIIVGQFVGSSALAAVGACAALTNVFICIALGAGVGAGESDHRCVGAARVSQQGAGAAVRQQIHPPLHGGAAPRRIAVLVGQRPAVAGGQAVEHGTNKGAPCGFAGFVGGADQIQAGMQVQLLLFQPAKGGIQVMNFHCMASFRGILYNGMNYSTEGEKCHLRGD